MYTAQVVAIEEEFSTTLDKLAAQLAESDKVSPRDQMEWENKRVESKKKRGEKRIVVAVAVDSAEFSTSSCVFFLFFILFYLFLYVRWQSNELLHNMFLDLRPEFETAKTVKDKEVAKLRDLLAERTSDLEQSQEKVVPLEQELAVLKGKPQN
jgi:hypothetical protein